MREREKATEAKRREAREGREVRACACEFSACLQEHAYVCLQEHAYACTGARRTASARAREAKQAKWTEVSRRRLERVPSIE